MSNALRSLISLAVLPLVFSNCVTVPTSRDSDSIAPPESPTPRAHVRASLPPPGWTSALAWAQALHDNRKQGPSSIEVDWLRLYCTVNGRDVLVVGETLSNATGTAGGGLYLREPWFGDNDSPEPLPSAIRLSGETFTLPLSTVPDRVWHWWGYRTVIPRGATKCWSAARVRPVGNALVQIGADWWKDPTIKWCGLDSCNYEAFNSDWFGALPNNDWIKITAGK